MTMQEIYTLQWEPLKAYYDNCIKTLTRLTEIDAEKKKLDKDIKRQADVNKNTDYEGEAILHGLSAGVILALIFGVFVGLAAYFILGELSDKTIGILVVVCLIVALITGFWAGRSAYKDENLRRRVDDRLAHGEAKLASLGEKREQTLLEETSILESDAYHDMMLMFDDHLDVEYMKALRKLVSNGRVLTHPEAVNTYVTEQRIKRQQELQEREAEAKEELARNTGRVADSQESLSCSIQVLSEKVDTLNAKCTNGAATKDDSESVLGAAAECSTLVANLFSLIKMM